MTFISDMLLVRRYEKRIWKRYLTKYDDNNNNKSISLQLSLSLARVFVGKSISDVVVVELICFSMFLLTDVDTLVTQCNNLTAKTKMTDDLPSSTRKKSRNTQHL
jgi:hypothetical protein